MEQKTEFMVAGTDKVFATHVGNIQSDEEIYGSLLDKLFTTYKAKNADYGSAFAEMFDELGIDYAYGKLREKMNRIKVFVMDVSLCSLSENFLAIRIFPPATQISPNLLSGKCSGISITMSCPPILILFGIFISFSF